LITSKMDYQLGLKEQIVIAPDLDFIIYPNPAKNILNIKGENFSNSTTFEMRDLNGRVVKRFKNETQIDISGVDNGIYLVSRMEKNKVIQTKKIVVH